MDSESSRMRHRTRAVRKIYWLPRIALAAFVVGAMAIAVAFLTEGNLGRWLKIGAGFWILAYFLILIDNFQRKIPIKPTIGKTIRHEDAPIRYILSSALPWLFGVFALLMFSFAVFVV